MPPPWNDMNSICQSHRSSNRYTAVCDPSGLLSSRDINRLDEQLSTIYSGRSPYSLVSCPQSSSSSSDQHGFRVSIALVRRMTSDEKSLPERAESFARTLFDRWGLNEGCGASVLVFLSFYDKRMYIATGTLAETYLNNDQVGKVESKMTSFLKKKEIAKALQAGVSEIAGYLRKYEGAHPTAGNPASSQTDASPRSGLSAPLLWRRGPEWWDLELSVVAALFAVLLVLSCCHGIGGKEATKRKREKKRVMSKLNVVRSEYVAATLPQYIPTTCPICQNDLTPPWVPTVPTLPESESLREEPARARPVRTLRCGHAFHDDCFDEENPTPSGTVPTCMVCGDKGGGNSSPPSLESTRAKDTSFRLTKLAQQYPHILTEDVVAKLSAETPNFWPERMTDSYLKARSTRNERGFPSGLRGGGDGGGFWNNWGGILAAGGTGAFLGSLFSGWGNRWGRGDGRYGDIPAPAAAGSQWYGGSGGGGGDGNWMGGSGRGAGWRNGSEAFGGVGHGAGWGGALAGAASRFSGGGGGLGSGWGIGGGGGGGGGSGQGTGW